MTNAPHAHTTPELLIAASMLVRIAHPGNASLHRALDKAQGRLTSQPWRLYAGHLEITSASHPNEIQSCDADYCSCKTTRGVCWHIAAFTVLGAIRAAGGVVRPALPLPDMVALDHAYGLDDSWDDQGDFLAQPSREVFHG